MKKRPIIHSRQAKIEIHSIQANLILRRSFGASYLINKAFQAWRNKWLVASRGLMKINLRLLKLWCSRLMVKVIASITSMLKVFITGPIHIQNVHHFSHSSQRKSIAKTDQPRKTFKKMCRLGRQTGWWQSCQLKLVLRGATNANIRSSRSSLWRISRSSLLLCSYQETEPTWVIDNKIPRRTSR